MHSFAKSSLLAAGLAFAASTASADLFIYEPFDYDATTPNNDNVYLGDGNQAGGLGLGTWTQANTRTNATTGFFENEAEVGANGLTYSDNFGNDLAVTGRTWERTVRQGQVATSSPVDSLATSGLTADGSTIWMTFLFQALGFSGPDYGIVLASEAMVGNDNQSLTSAGVGVGFSVNSVGGSAVRTDRFIGTSVYDNSTEFTSERETTATFSSASASDVRLLAMKVNWNAAGTPDEIFVFDLTDNDLTIAPDESEALASDTFDFTLAEQQSLDFFNISDTQVSRTDEVRIADNYLESVGIPEPSSLALLGLGGLLIARRRRG